MKRRADGRWVKVKTFDGNRISFYSTAETEKKALKDIENQMIAYSQKLNFSSHNFKILANKMLEFQNLSVTYNTSECYTYSVKHLSPLFGYNIEDITPAMVQELLDNMATIYGYSFSAVAKTKVVFGLILDFAIVHEKLPLSNFTRSLKVPKNAKKGKVTSPPINITKTIIENAARADFGRWALCLLCTGLRRGELAALQRKDIDFDSGLIDVNKAVIFVVNQPQIKPIPKNDASIDTVPILQILRPHLETLCDGLDPNDFLFGGKKPLSKTMIDKRWKKYCSEIGYTFNGHQLRHAYAKLLYKAGLDPKTMQRLLRHANFQTTMDIYTDFSNEMTDKSVTAVNEYLTNF